MRAAPLAVFLGFVAFGVIWLSRDPILRRHAYPPGSSLSTAAQGTSLASAYLAARGVRVTMLTRPLAQASLPSKAVLFRIAPGPERNRGPEPAIGETEPEEVDGGVSDAGAQGAGPAPARMHRGKPRSASAGHGFLTDSEDAFVREGGRLVLLLRGEPAVGQLRKVLPLLPGVRVLEPAESRSLPPAALIDVQPVFGRDAAPAVARRLLGKGEVWLLSDPEILYNDRLPNANHLELLSALAGSDRPVFFDEHVHGLRDEAGVLGLLRRWGLGPALLFSALALGALYWRGAVTLGPPADAWRDSRGESVELVDSMAALYRRALSPAQALHLYRARFVREIALTKGLSDLRAEALLPELAPDLHLPPLEARISEAEFRALLHILVRSLERFRHAHRRSRS